jgi:hypothetical protein
VSGLWDQIGLTSDLDGPIVSDGHNLIQHILGASISGPAARDLYGVDPLLGPLQDNGGPTLTMALRPGSPAIDAGDAGTAPLQDQRGVNRLHFNLYLDQVVVDIGAVAYP